MKSPRARPAVRKIGPISLITLGVVLMIGKIVADSEPGAIPILLVLLGVGWYAFLHIRERSQHRSDGSR